MYPIGILLLTAVKMSLADASEALHLIRHRMVLCPRCGPAQGQYLQLTQFSPIGAEIADRVALHTQVLRRNCTLWRDNHNTSWQGKLEQWSPS